MSESSEPTAAAAAARAFGAYLDDDGLDGEFGTNTEYPDQVDYYSLLGLAQKPPPTDAEIRSAYRNLSLMFHPDKQPPHLQESAEQHFTRIQIAYDTLIDPKKRVVYDLLGAEGVANEWRVGGAMGRGGEAERLQVGVKAMTPEEFRRWFTKTMKKRERKAVEELVNSRGSITLGINAQSTIRVDEDNDVTVQVPSQVLPTSYAAKYSFKTPLALPTFGRRTDEDEAQDQQEKPDAGVADEEGEDPVYVTFNAGISGNLVRPKQPIAVEYADGTSEEMEIPLPAILMAKNISLGATVTPNVRELIGTKGIWNNRLFSTLRDSTVLVEANIFPVPLLKTTVARAFQPIPGIKPFQVTTQTIFQRSLLESPPSFEVHVTKEVAPRKLAFCAWSSGLWYYPDLLLDHFSSLGMTVEDMYAHQGDLSSLQIGLISLPKLPQNVIEINEDDEGSEDEEMRQSLLKQKQIDRAAEAWQTFVQVSPGGGALGLTYSRNLFSGTPATESLKAEWSDEGYAPFAKMEDARAVRVEVSTTVSPDLSFTWNIKGTRRIGEYTKMSIGMGFTPQGILMTIGWGRLGQGLNLPVLLCSKDEATHDAAVLANIFTWATYLAIEFGYVRPRDRKRRREAVARRHNQLKRLIPQKRAESEQAVQLMVDQVRRRQAREDEQGGLVIDRAEYGYYPPTDRKPKPGFEESRVTDVFLPVANLVDRGQLVISKNTVKHQIIGFYDPAPLLKKRLKIWYRFQDRDHFVDIGDKEGVVLPQRTHMLPDHEQSKPVSL
ncbi:uncharacterized protein N7482_002748 [Penicillium canariense]|uniref:J domain-containing protein n=1 Tax=Penicillium canariense TaxID=189055 RepID=A0A9W9LUA9_9EURO|nr:uncharacterized protein N7482_002748 [Penicillium canariense]KAJ5176871.1 hypothetical protein N7482_002748 [Penicillium canariense]